MSDGATQAQADTALTALEAARAKTSAATTPFRGGYSDLGVLKRALGHRIDGLSGATTAGDLRGDVGTALSALR